VQTGIGRTGAWFAHQLPDIGGGVVPDVVTVAKGLGGGIPIGACIGTGRAAELLQPGNHGTTFGGNPVAATAALAVLDTIESEGLLDDVAKLGETLRRGLATEHVVDVRGRGLLIGIGLDAPRASAVARVAQSRGFIVNDCTPERIRLAPPLVLTDADAESFLDAWPGMVVDAFAEAPDGGSAT